MGSATWFHKEVNLGPTEGYVRSNSHETWPVWGEGQQCTLLKINRKRGCADATRYSHEEMRSTGSNLSAGKTPQWSFPSDGEPYFVARSLRQHLRK
jgi:hypothetical protein